MGKATEDEPSVLLALCIQDSQQELTQPCADQPNDGKQLHPGDGPDGEKQICHLEFSMWNWWFPFKLLDCSKAARFPWTASLGALAFQAPSFKRSVDHWGQKLPAFPKPSSCPGSPEADFPSLLHTPQKTNAQAQQSVRRATLGFCFKFPRGAGEIHTVQEKRELLLLLGRFLFLWKILALHALSWAVATYSA